MVLEKYKRWPQAIIENHKVWKRDKVKGWFVYVEFDNRRNGGGYCSISRFINHPDFVGCKQIMKIKDIPIKQTT